MTGMTFFIFYSMRERKPKSFEQSLPKAIPNIPTMRLA